MTALLQRAVDVITALSPEEQDAYATRLLAELAAEDAFDRRIAETAHRLAGLAAAAQAEHEAGETVPLDPDQL